MREDQLERLQAQVSAVEQLQGVSDRIHTEILASQTGEEALRQFAESARQLIGAQYCAIGVARADGAVLEEFLTAGLTHEQERAIGAKPHGVGVLGLLLHRETPLRLESLTAHPMSAGIPAHHPPMESFLGVPIRYETTVLGSIYLTEKPGGFTEADERTILALSMHLAVAIRNWQLLKRQRALVAGLITAQEEERRAVAYDLHDGLTQYVMAAHMHLSAFQRVHGTADDDLMLGLKYLKDAVVESRRLVNGLRSLALDDMGLAGALAQLVQEEKSRAGWAEADFLHNVEGERFATPVVTALYRVAQEALTNARKHAGARRVQVALLREDETQLTLSVTDDGHGFEPGRSHADDKHIGLHGMTERVRLLEGTLQIESAPGQGTQLTVTVPIPYQEEEE
ncbi:GAF domain-containing sensor histidine kinase [Armatimonas rosea]|uniref:Signal transduction histidine kinase n=1 Tax=Armatimonas rosea TaxID=685828 RepID=A0A7W9SQU6_ARMRO|nr:GAF domain-containing sensor histidine kinase [Armatimonas rosea]MBB6051140.1 signal transduction histidine kinase [Armatimonas rosea]